MRDRFELFPWRDKEFPKSWRCVKPDCRRGAIVASSRQRRGGCNGSRRPPRTAKQSGFIYFGVRKNVGPCAVSRFAARGNFAMKRFLGRNRLDALTVRADGHWPNDEDGCGQRSRREETFMYLGLDLGTSGVKALLIDARPGDRRVGQWRARRVAAASRLVGAGPRALDQGDRRSGRQAQALARQGACRRQRHRPVRPDAWRDADRR